MTTDTKRLAKIMKALANENRLKLYLEIAQRQQADFEDNACAVTSIMCLFNLTAPTISHHLKELTNADLITTERKGKFVVARINPDTIQEVERVLAVVRGG